MVLDFLLIVIIVVVIDILKERNRKKNGSRTTSNYYQKRKYTTYSSRSPYKNDKYKRRGEIGERKLFDELSQKIPGKKFILNNLYTFNDDNSRSEIDLILIHTTGIYVIESKNYRGYISGNRYEKYLYQTFYIKGQKKTKKFYNPVHQNYGHICSLQKMLGINSKNYFKSYIAFGNSAHIDHIRYSDDELVITNYNNIINHIINDILKKSNIFTYDQMYLYYYKLKPFCHRNDEIAEQHIKDTKEKITN